MTSEATLKPCPFCGDKALMCSYTIKTISDHYLPEDVRFGALCKDKNCFASNQLARYKTLEEATERWNKRQ